MAIRRTTARADPAGRTGLAAVSAGEVVATAVLSAGVTMFGVGGHDPFAFVFLGVVVELHERTALDAGEAYVRVLPGRDGFLRCQRSCGSM